MTSQMLISKKHIRCEFFDKNYRKCSNDFAVDSMQYHPGFQLPDITNGREDRHFSAYFDRSC